jgi:hypothetical protein
MVLISLSVLDHDNLVAPAFQNRVGFTAKRTSSSRFSVALDPALPLSGLTGSC